MKVRRLEMDTCLTRLPQPLSISFHTVTYQENFFVRLFDGEGHVGWGEGAPLEAITGDTLEDALTEAQSLELRAIPDLDRPDAFYDRVIAPIKSSCLRAALDFAAHDLVAKARGIPVYGLYTSSPRTVPNSVTVFLQQTAEATAGEAARLLEQYPHVELLKIKLKGEGDIDRCRAIRGVVPDRIQFMLDANQGFTDGRRAVDDLSVIAETLGQVILVEEPCPKHDLQTMAYVKERLEGMLVFADESCVDESDVAEIVAAGCAHGINIKLQKSGGITPAKRMAKSATDGGLKIMLGAMFETPLAHAAGAHFAASTEGVLLTDLDMDLDLPCFSRGRVPFQNGRRVPRAAPGFGFEFDPSGVDRLRSTGVLRLETVVRLEV